LNWHSYIKLYKAYLKLEKGLSENSIDAYCRDLDKLLQFLKSKDIDSTPKEITKENIEELLVFLSEFGINPRSQARIISGLKSFFNYLCLENEINHNPVELIDSPKLPKKLPDFLSVEEIDKIISCLDLSKPENERNRAILETLYGCGLRVSELVNLLISNLFFEEEFIRVTGKGNKERLVPINPQAIKRISIYMDTIRCHQKIRKGEEDYLFINRLGTRLSRQFIFMMLKKLVLQANIPKKISPHTFRHSFATHLVEGGADLRVIQEMLGHESITTTEIYTHLNRDFLRQSIIEFHPRYK